MNMLDETLQRSMPSVMVPKYEALARLETFGERLLVAQNGIFLEVSRPWLSLVRLVAKFSVDTAVPYGAVEELTKLRCARVPADLVQAFLAMAREALPNETAAWIVWNAVTRGFRLVPVVLLEHSPDALSYDVPRLEHHEVLVVDCHSHGRTPAFFSPTDNRDDNHDVKMALVVGNCDRSVPSLALRICAKGIFDEIERIPTDWYTSTAVIGSAQ